jgi:hypothetical protein
MHLSPPGHNFLARLLVGMLRNQKILTDAEFERIVQVARYDSTAPDKPHASWVVEPQHIEALPGSDFHVSVLAQNTGNTKLLRQFKIPEFGRQKNVSYGAVCIEGRWKSINAPTTATIATTRLSHDLLPRETTSQTLTFKSPQSPGAYLMQIGFDADRVGELERFGAETTTLTVNVRPPA